MIDNPNKMAILHTDRRGYTLLEVTVVLTLIALLAAVVIVSWIGPLRAQRLEDASDRIVVADQLLREYAYRHGTPCHLTISLDDQWLAGRHESSGQEIVQPSYLGRGVRVQRVSVGSHVEHGQVLIPYSADGQSPTFGVVLTDASGRTASVFFSGMTGEVMRTDDALAADQLLAALAEGADPRGSAR